MFTVDVKQQCNNNNVIFKKNTYSGVAAYMNVCCFDSIMYMISSVSFVAIAIPRPRNILFKSDSAT